ncbi:MAG: hypothetical protein ACLFUF_06620 [Opitutales bacterium]
MCYDTFEKRIKPPGGCLWKAPGYVCFLQLCAAVLFLLSPLSTRAQTGGEDGLRVLEPGAIPYLRFLEKERFDERFPGERVASVSGLEPGWYVVYEHKALNYYFGPILLESIGKDYLEELQAIVKEAVAERPSIQDYRLELSREPSVSDHGKEAAEERREESDDASGSRPSGSEPPPRRGFWGWLRRAFGF